MTGVQAYLRLFFSPYGRINRRVFIHAWLILACIYCIFVGATLQSLTLSSGLLGWGLTLYPSVCVYTHRLHDVGRSGWWQAYPHVSVGVFFLFGLASSNGEPRLFDALIEYSGSSPVFAGALGMGLLAIVVFGLVAQIVLLFWLALKRGEDRPAEIFE